MSKVAFAPRAGVDHSDFGTVHVTAGQYHEWDVDVRGLVDAGPIVLDTDTDQPVIDALDAVEGLKRVDSEEFRRTLPEHFSDMNRAQLASTDEGNAVPGKGELSESELRHRMAEQRRDHEDDHVGDEEAGRHAYEVGEISPPAEHEHGESPSGATPDDVRAGGDDEDRDAQPAAPQDAEADRGNAEGGGLTVKDAPGNGGAAAGGKTTSRKSGGK